MSQVTVAAGGINVVLNLPNGPLPVIDPLTGNTWQVAGAGTTPGSARLAAPQPGTYDNSFTKPQSNPVVFKSPAQCGRTDSLESSTKGKKSWPTYTSPPYPELQSFFTILRNILFLQAPVKQLLLR